MRTSHDTVPITIRSLLYAIPATTDPSYGFSLVEQYGDRATDGPIRSIAMDSSLQVVYREMLGDYASTIYSANQTVHHEPHRRHRDCVSGSTPRHRLLARYPGHSTATTASHLVADERPHCPDEPGVPVISIKRPIERHARILRRLIAARPQSRGVSLQCISDISQIVQS